MKAEVKVIQEDQRAEAEREKYRRIQEEAAAQRKAEAKEAKDAERRRQEEQQRASSSRPAAASRKLPPPKAIQADDDVVDLCDPDDEVRGGGRGISLSLIIYLPLLVCGGININP